MKTIQLIGVICVFLSSILSIPVIADDSLEKANELINTNQYQAAYQLLVDKVEQQAGNPDFDLLLGVAALNTGRFTQAVFALERLLAVEPNNARARLELARAYFEMGENEAAKEEFNFAKTQELPDDVSKTIEEYLTAIDSRISGEKRHLSFYLQARTGYDSNVNSATDSSTVAIPAFGNLVFTLNNNAQELDSAFSRIDAGVAFSNQIFQRNDLMLFGGANIYYRPTYNEQDFDTGAVDGQVGLRYTRDNNAFIGSLLGQKYVLDGDSNRNQAGVNLQWLHLWNKRTQLSVFGRGLVQRFPGQNVRDVNQYTGGAGIVHALQTKGDPLVYASAFIGTDEQLNDQRDDIGRRFAGFRAGGQYTLRDNLDLVGGISYQYSRYGDEDPLFRERRRDHFVFLRAGLDYTFKNNWLITPEIQYIHNDSSLVINEFDRWQLFVTARYSF